MPMKLVYENVEFDHGSLLKVAHYVLPYFDMPWHFHPELELVLITKGYGKRYVGYHIAEFEVGDVVFLGGNLPHLWINAPEFYTKGGPVGAEVIVAQFDPGLLGAQLLQLHEFEVITRLLKKADMGIRVFGKTAVQLDPMIRGLLPLSGVPRFSLLLNILDIMSRSAEIEVLCPDGYAEPILRYHSDRLTDVFRFVMDQYHRPIRVGEVARVANINESAFCRYFKAQTGKTFLRYLNELRISYARKLLMNGSFSISQIAMECGFANLSTFNRQFKGITGNTPREFRQLSPG